MKDKIVILIGHFGRGGSERQAYLLARELRQRHGLNAEVWALTYGGEYAEEFEAAGVPTRVLGFRFPKCPVKAVRVFHWAGRLRHVATRMREAGVDVLLPFTIWPNVVAGLTYRWAGVRVCIWGERSAGTEDLPGPGRIAVRRYRRFAANSTAGVEFLAQEMRIARERILFVPNGVEEPQVDARTDWRARLGLKPGQPLVVKVANVTNYKDHPTLLRAWKIVQDAWTEGDRPFLALAGYLSDAYDECQQISREAGLESTVRFLGGIPDVATLLHACDMTAFSSPKEGMPNGVLECMAAGKAIVASDLPGVRDALGPNAAGVLVPPGDANQFARALLSLLRDKEKRDALGKANRARIRGEFSVERMVERYLKIIQESLPSVAASGSRGMAIMRNQGPARSVDLSLKR
jgi:glycosyltransferase involved in cell wall biosynthesis